MSDEARTLPARYAGEWLPAAPIASRSLVDRGHTFMMQAARRLWWLLVDLSQLAHSEPALTIDLKRVNMELHRTALVGLDDDISYRERVKQRIREGARCTHPPLIDTKRVLPFAPLRISG
jgi:hypothetical protein